MFSMTKSDDGFCCSFNTISVQSTYATETGEVDDTLYNEEYDYDYTTTTEDYDYDDTTTTARTSIEGEESGGEGDQKC
jgi:hypothetical protein